MAEEKKGEKFLTLKNVLIIFVPILIAIVVLAFDFLRFWGHPFFDDMVLYAFLIATLPFATSKYIEFRRIRKMEGEFPSFLADISSAVDSGMSIPQAIYTTKTRDYGILTKEVQKMTLQVSWGIPFEDVLIQFSERAKSPFIEKLTYLILQANRSGGDVRSLLRSTAKNARDLKDIEKEISTMIKPYVYIAYATFLVFLGIILILYKQFILPLSQQGGSPILTGFSPEIFTSIFFHMLMLQALFIGLAAGKFSERRIIAGLRHSIILIVIGYVVYNSVVGWEIPILP